MAGWQNGLCRGLQILLYWFNSGTGLQEKSFQRSSVVEQSAVNRSVVGSSPTAGAIKERSRLGSFFYAFYIDELKPRKTFKEKFSYNERNLSSQIPFKNMAKLNLNSSFSNQ